MASNGDPAFYSSISRVFDSWTALQLAVQYGFGGIDSMEKSKWIVDVVYQWFQDNKDIEDFELEEFIETITNNEFDMIADDGSLANIAKTICKHYSMCQNGKESEVLKELEKLPKAATQQSVRKADEDEGDQVEHNKSSDIAAEMRHLNLSATNGSLHVDNNQAEVIQSKDNNIDEDGWSIVTKKGKKR